MSKETNKAWRLANPEKVKEYARQTYLKKDPTKLKKWDPIQRKLQQRKWAAANPHYKDKILYGLAPGARQGIFEMQGRCCALCKTTTSSRWCLDHCHTTGRVRGILCNNCNTGLGRFNDDPLLLHAAVRYLLKEK